MFTKRLRQYFTSSTRFRGHNYCNRRKVSLRAYTDEVFEFVVLGSKKYRVFILKSSWDLSVGDIIAHCNCPYYQTQTRESFCKHIWAVLAFMDQLVHIDIFRKSTRSNMFRLDEYGAREGLFEDEFMDMIKERISDVGIVSGQERLPEKQPWKRDIENLGKTIQMASMEKVRQQNYRELYYALEIPSNYQNWSDLRLRIFQRERMASGTMGRLKRYSCPARWDSLYAELANSQDREIVTMFNSHLVKKHGNTDAYLSIPHPLQQLALEKIAPSGRLIALYENVPYNRQDHVHLSFDKEPFVFHPYVAATEKFWKLAGILQWGEKRVPFSEVRIMSPCNFIVWEDIVHPFSIKKEYRPYFEQVCCKKELNIPKEHRDDLKMFIEDFMNPEDILFDESFNFKKELLKGIPKFDISNNPHKIEGFLYFEYDGEKHEPLAESKLKKRDDGDVFFAKDVGHEREVVEKIESLDCIGSIPSMSHNRYAIQPDHFVEVVQYLNENGVEVRAEGDKLVSPTRAFSSVSSGVNWFGLDSEVEFEDLKIAAPEILKAARENRQYVRLAGNKLGILPKNWLKRYMRLQELAIKNKDGTLHFHNSQALILDALLEEQVVERDESYSKIVESFKNYKKLKMVEAPKAFKGVLRPYQKIGLSWMMFLQELNMAGCLADDMGLGKTIQVLALLQKRKFSRKRKSKTSCIVVPKTVVSNWNNEVSKFTPGLNVCIYEGSERESLRQGFSDVDIVIMTYGILRRDILELKKNHFDYVILDEAQAIKNESSLSAKTVCLLNASHRLALTGTPVENHLGELFSIFKFLIPGIFSKKISSYQNLNQIDDATELVLKGLRPFMLRRTKEEVLTDLPEKIETVLYCDMPSEQQKEYDKIKNYYRTHLSEKIDLQGINKSKIQILEALMRLRQAACHPGLLDSDKISQGSGKMEALVEQLETIRSEGKRALVFSQFTSMLSIVKKELERTGIFYSYLDGSTRNREKVISEFKNHPDISIFLISLKAGGVGLNLTEANYCFILDPWWNPAVESQAIDRAYRIGQKNKVTAYKLISKNTVEEKIVELQNKKKELYKDVMFSNDNILKKITMEDVSYLFS